MDLTNATSISDIEYQTSKKITKSLVDKIKNQEDGSSANFENSSNQQSLNLQLNFMTTFSETFEAK